MWLNWINEKFCVSEISGSTKDASYRMDLSLDEDNCTAREMELPGKERSGSLHMDAVSLFFAVSVPLLFFIVVSNPGEKRWFIFHVKLVLTY